MFLRGPGRTGLSRVRQAGGAAARRHCAGGARRGPVQPLAARHTRVGGLDFGFRNPFAAVWGHSDRDGVQWLTGEHYAREQPLSYHAARLPQDVMWYADPAGASEISELHRADFLVRKGNNDLRLGIMAVTARL